jgi:hypothetical protein
VGESITWTAAPSDCLPDLVYQFRVATAGNPSQMMQDFSPVKTFQWTPMEEGSYEVSVIAKGGYHGTQNISAMASDEVKPRATGTDPVVTRTSNPLVALFSAPPDLSGMIHVEFAVAGPNAHWKRTNVLPAVPGQTTNFLVAGMEPNTTYQMRYVKSDGFHSRSLLFRTGSLSSTLAFPTFNVVQPPGPGSDLKEDVVLHWVARSPLGTPSPLATDLQGNVDWYYDVQQGGVTNIDSGSLVPGGTVLLLANDPAQALGGVNIVREVDLAGHPIRETNLAAVNEQLMAMGHDPIYGFHHDAERLPNGATAVLGHTHRVVDINGTPTDYEGDAIIVLDRDFQVAWAWDAFDYLDVNRGPILHETDLLGVDWLHANAIHWSPADGNLIMSMRSQDGVIKVAYQDGTGDGHIIWRLGKDGDFTANSADPYPWFSHQHDMRYVDDTTVVVFDDGNARIVKNPNGDSRGQVWKLDETTMAATPLLNADLGTYSLALGAAERLTKGDYSFTSGFLGDFTGQYGQTVEVRPDGSIAYVLQENGYFEYRSYRVRTLYAGEGTAQNPTNPNAAGQADTGAWVAILQMAPVAGMVVSATSVPGSEDGNLVVTPAANALAPASLGDTAVWSPATPLPVSGGDGGAGATDAVFTDLDVDGLASTPFNDHW